MVKAFIMICLEMLDVWDIRDALRCWLLDWFVDKEQSDGSDGEETEIGVLCYIDSRYEV